MFMVFKKYKNQSSKLDLKTTIFLICYHLIILFFLPLDPLTVNNQTLNHLLMGVCLLQATYEFFIFLPSRFSPIPSSQSYLLFYVSVFRLIFSTKICLFFPRYKCLFPPPHPSDGLTSLFKDWEWIVHTRLEPQQFSDREGLRDSSLVCVCANVQFQFWT